MKWSLCAAVACLVPAAGPAADYTVTSNLPPKYTVTSNLPPAPSGVNPLTPAKTRRVRVAGYWWDELPNGTLRWCESCNGPYPAGGVPGMVVVDWNGYRPPAPAVSGRPGG